MNAASTKKISLRGSRVPMSVTYTAVLPVRDETVQFLERLLEAERPAGAPGRAPGR
jgi:hypothetical protein